MYGTGACRYPRRFEGRTGISMWCHDIGQIKRSKDSAVIVSIARYLETSMILPSVKTDSKSEIMFEIDKARNIGKSEN
jgi:hypothetical protein